MANINSSSTSTTSASIPVTTSNSFSSSATIHYSGPNTASFLKLDEHNYLEWLRQMKPFLIGQDLFKYVDVSTPAPSPIVSVPSPIDTNSVGAPAMITAPNPEFTFWYRHDQLVVSYITTTLTKQIISLTIGRETSQEIWNCLQCHFAQKSLASSASLQFQLMDMTKGSKTIDEYLQHAKSIADSLAAIQKPVDSEYLVTAILRGLGPDYLMLRTAILQTPHLPSFSDLRSRILAFESQDPNLSNNSQTLPHTALYTSSPRPTLHQTCSA